VLQTVLNSASLLFKFKKPSCLVQKDFFWCT
jgi:hypothetical protein